jgi:hypothetical protein
VDFVVNLVGGTSREARGEITDLSLQSEPPAKRLMGEFALSPLDKQEGHP